MTDLLIACGTSTLKSPPPRAFSVPDVHPRPRKRLSRCTLDCGFQTPESPALRGFVAERCPITGTSLYLVLKSNGLHRPKIRLKKFGFSPKIVPANIAKKLPPQRCFEPLFIVFSTSRTSGPRLLSRLKAGTHSPSVNRIAHKGLHGETGAFPLSSTAQLLAAGEIFYSATLLYTYISRFSVNPHYISRGKNPAKLPP